MASEGRPQLPDGTSGSRHRVHLLSGLPVTERRLQVAGVSTSVLEGGAGSPILLLHGPGDFAGMWMRVIPDLVTTHRIIAPDLPGHGASHLVDSRLDADGLRAWLSGVIERTCPSPPVLVDSLGLARFRPRPTFALTMLAFLALPTERTYTRFMRQCSFDLDGLRHELGQRWEPFLAYSLERARGPNAKIAGRLLREFGIPRIAPDDLARIAVPTTLIWGRHDRANRLRIAQAASDRYRWPLHVIEHCADDPPRDQPLAFMEALRVALATERKQEQLTA